MQERCDVLHTAAAAHISPRWIKDELRTSSTAPRPISLQHLLFTLELTVFASPHLDTEMRCTRVHVLEMLERVWVRFCSASILIFIEALFHLTDSQHLCSRLQSIMGRKKIQIQRITDERNKQVSHTCETKGFMLISLLFVWLISSKK